MRLVGAAPDDKLQMTSYLNAINPAKVWTRVWTGQTQKQKSPESRGLDA